MQVTFKAQVIQNKNWPTHFCKLLNALDAPPFGDKELDVIDDPLRFTVHTSVEGYSDSAMDAFLECYGILTKNTDTFKDVSCHYGKELLDRDTSSIAESVSGAVITDNLSRNCCDHQDQTSELEPCPFDLDIRNKITLCNCCPECRDRCKRDIN